MWSLYVKEAEKIDKDLIEDWTDRMNGILIFVRPALTHMLESFLTYTNHLRKAGLFSAVITAFIVESYRDLSEDTSVILLTRISVQLAGLNNGSQALSASLEPDGSSYNPPASAIGVNILWFLSLIFSLLCALAATLVQQWARNYKQAVGRHQDPIKRGKVRSYLSDGIEESGMLAAVNCVPALLHISLFLFLTGLCIFLLQINHAVGLTTLGIIVLAFGLYFVTSVIQMFHQNYPFRTPLSSVLHPLFNLSTNLLIGLLRFMEVSLYRIGPHRYAERFSFNMGDLISGHTQRQTAQNQDFSQLVQVDVTLGQRRSLAKVIQLTGATANEEKDYVEFVEALPGLLPLDKTLLSHGEAYKVLRAINPGRLGHILVKSKDLVGDSRIKLATACMHVMFSCLDLVPTPMDRELRKSLYQWYGLGTLPLLLPFRDKSRINGNGLELSDLAFCTSARICDSLFSSSPTFDNKTLSSLTDRLQRWRTFQLPAAPSRRMDDGNPETFVRPYESLLALVHAASRLVGSWGGVETHILHVFECLQNATEQGMQLAFVNSTAKPLFRVLDADSNNLATDISGTLPLENLDLSTTAQRILHALTFLDDDQAVRKAVKVFESCLSQFPDHEGLHMSLAALRAKNIVHEDGSDDCWEQLSHAESAEAVQLDLPTSSTSPHTNQFDWSRTASHPHIAYERSLTGTIHGGTSLGFHPMSISIGEEPYK